MVSQPRQRNRRKRTRFIVDIERSMLRALFVCASDVEIVATPHEGYATRAHAARMLWALFACNLGCGGRGLGWRGGGGGGV